MEICQIVNYVLICFVVNQELTAQACQDDQLTVKLPDGNVTCMNCPKCPPGEGATTTCGSTVPYNVSVECKVCMPEHYSDSFSSESCKPCSKCMPDEVIVAKCTKISDTHCSCKPCPKGYYRNQTLSKCLPCSGCCLGAGVDVVVPQCVSQGMPRAQICSYHKRKPCTAKCWYDEMTVVKHDGKNSCLPCPVCSNEFGLTKPCGCFIHDHDVLPKCERPTLGKTFVNQQGILQSCKICSTGQEVVVNCSANSDTICGGCKSGFYFNDLSKSCEECFWCCSHGDSRQITKCIREGLIFVEHQYHSLLHRQPFPSLPENTQSDQANQELGYIMRLLNLGVIFILFLLALNFILQRKMDCATKEVSYNVTNLETMECTCMPLLKKQHSETAQTLITATSDTSSCKKVEAEYPIRQNPGHVVFEKTGVEVLTLESSISALQDVPGDLALQAISDCLDMPGFLEDGELPLSPAIQFICSKLDGPLEVQIPHGANMVLSSKKWKVILKEFLNNKWVVVNDAEGKGIKEFAAKSNHVRFETDHLSTFAVVGYADKQFLSLFKRMKVMAFCSETRAGEDLVVRVYCFDDCEWSFERLMRKERKEGGKLMSSIESLDFSVTCEEDVEISVKDIDGWKLGSGCPTKLSYTSLRNSFNIIPQCNLVFNTTVGKGNSSFFVTIVLTQSFSQTAMYASTAIKEDPTLHMNPNMIPNVVNEGVHQSDVVNVTTVNHKKPKEESITKCIIQL